MDSERQSLQVPLADVRLDGDLTLPPDAGGLVVFAHGSGSGRHSPRNRAVAATLVESGLATFLMDLLTAEEEPIDERTGRLRFDIELLAERLGGTTDWLGRQPTLTRLRMGYFGASTGAAAALVAAARHPERVDAIVSRGGRPDLAESSLPAVRAPTLLIVGGRDETVQQLNRQALARLPVESRLVVIPGATHLFPEPGALEAVARLATGWFQNYLARRATQPPA